jgi:uncharacterized protein (UPF0218 family)
VRPRPRAGGTEGWFGMAGRTDIATGVRLPRGTSLVMPDDMRHVLGSPLGPIASENEALRLISPGRPVATIGDMCTARLHALGVAIHLAIVDNRTRRADGALWADMVEQVGERVVRVRNPTGVLTSELWNAIIDAWTDARSARIVVEGEEDLASLAAILHAPEGATVIYGIPDRGLALVQVDRSTRLSVVEALDRFERRTRGGSPEEGG